MNKLYIIGNGFDLAHGLKTRYSDFLLWYINKFIKIFNASNSDIYEDGLMIFESKDHKIPEFESLTSLKEYFSKSHSTLSPKNFLFGRIYNQSDELNWVDIEYEYYLALLMLYRKVEKHHSTKFEGSDKLLIGVNSCFEFLKKELIEYLSTIRIQLNNKEIEARFNSELKKRNIDKVLFLVFNYTNTIELYLKSLNIKSYKVIYIHGQLNEESNPIIFGYGDEMDEYYKKIESLNVNGFLINMKAFSYLMTTNYSNLTKFIDDGDFTVSIMGHSCGISDRILLNSIFCHQNCREIRIFYYKKNDNENDFFEKIQEISRHFSNEHKNRMRNLIVPLVDSQPLS